MGVEFAAFLGKIWDKLELRQSERRCSGSELLPSTCLTMPANSACEETLILAIHYVGAVPFLWKTRPIIDKLILRWRWTVDLQRPITSINGCINERVSLSWRGSCSVCLYWMPQRVLKTRWLRRNPRPNHSRQDRMISWGVRAAASITYFSFSLFSNSDTIVQSGDMMS